MSQIFCQIVGYICLLVLIGIAADANVYPDCEADTAKNCENKKPDEYCAIIATIKTGIPNVCVNPLYEDISANCLKACSQCCRDPAYNCQDSPPDADFKCDDFKKFNGCISTLDVMRKTAAEFCPGTCGKCNLITTTAAWCFDKDPSLCDMMKGQCLADGYKEFMEDQCAKTCNACHHSVSTTAAPAPRCENKSEQECTKKRYLCTNPDYKDLMTRLCPLICNLC